MGRAHIDPHPCFRVDPSVEKAATRKYKTMRSIVVNNRQFQVTVEWRIAYRLPFHAEMFSMAALVTLT
jgi:hypothetical protein